MKYGFVYIWYDRKHSRYYIGAHWGLEDDGYICSSPWMKQAFAKRPDDFKRRILARIYSSKQDMFNEEARWQSFIKDDELKVRYYNIRRHGDRHWTTSEEKSLSIREKISLTMKAKHQDPEYKEMYNSSRKHLKGKKQNPEFIAKRTAAIKLAKEKQFPIEGRKVRAAIGSEELRKKLSEASKKRWSQPGAKEKQSAISSKINKGKQRRLGHINTPEHRQKISDSLKGKKHSPESIQKMADSKRGKPMPEGFKEARSKMMKEIWAKRKSGELPMPDYS